jgi:hypothetical protein
VLLEHNDGSGRITVQRNTPLADYINPIVRVCDYMNFEIHVTFKAEASPPST